MSASESSHRSRPNAVLNVEIGAEGTVRGDETPKRGRRWWSVARQRRHLRIREGCNSKRIVEGVPEVSFTSAGVEYSPKRRQNESERA